MSLSIAEPGAATGDDLVHHAQIENVSLIADAPIVHHVEFGDAERRGDFVFDHLGPYSLTHDILTVFQLPNAADVDAAGTVELQRPTTRGCFRTAKHNANLFTNLVDEDH